MVYFNEKKIVQIKRRFLLELLRYSPQLRQFPLQALTKVILTDWPLRLSDETSLLISTLYFKKN